MADESQTNRPSEPLFPDAKHPSDRLVVIPPDGEDRFVRDCQWVAEASRARISRDIWLRELYALFAHTLNWVEERSDRIASCFAAQRDGEIAVYVVPRNGSYDSDLADELTELDLELAKQFQTCPCDVLQVPPSTAGTIINSGGLVAGIYGIGEQPEQAQSEVAP